MMDQVLRNKDNFEKPQEQLKDETEKIVSVMRKTKQTEISGASTRRFGGQEFDTKPHDAIFINLDPETHDKIKND